MKNGQSRNTDNIGYKTKNDDKQTKQRKLKRRAILTLQNNKGGVTPGARERVTSSRFL